MSHAYFEGLHNPEEEPLAEIPFDWSFDNFEPTKDILQSMVYDEALKFHPEWLFDYLHTNLNMFLIQMFKLKKIKLKGLNFLERQLLIY